MNKAVNRIVILGAGAGGLRCALDLARLIGRNPSNQIILVDKNPYHTLHATLYDVIVNNSLTTHSAPIKQIIAHKPIHYIQDLVTKVDPIKQVVRLHAKGEIAYNYLVIALGAMATNFSIPGLRDNALVVHTAEDAILLKKKLRYGVRTNGKIKVTIIGGGALGIELASSLAESSLSDKMSIEIIEQSGRLLPGAPIQLAEKAQELLTRLNINIYFGHAITSVTHSKATLNTKRAIEHDLLIWTGGTTVHPFIRQAGFELDKNGRIVTSPMLHARGYSRVYVLGDAASVRVVRRVLPKLASHAIDQGSLIARNISRQISDQRLRIYQPQNYFFFLTIGKLGLGNFLNLTFASPNINWLRRMINNYYWARLLSHTATWRLFSKDSA